MNNEINSSNEVKQNNFWEDCNQKTKTEIVDLLVNRLGEPKNDLDKNCLDALAGKVIYFYSEGKDTRSKAISSIVGQVSEITQTVFGPNNRKRGQIYYLIRLVNKTTLRAIKEDLSEEKWTQVEKLELLDQNLLFKYRFSIFGKDICDFQPVGSEPTEATSQHQPQNDKVAAAPDTDGKNQVN